MITILASLFSKKLSVDWLYMAGVELLIEAVIISMLRFVMSYQ